MQAALFLGHIPPTPSKGKVWVRRTSPVALCPGCSQLSEHSYNYLYFLHRFCGFIWGRPRERRVEKAAMGFPSNHWTWYLALLKVAVRWRQSGDGTDLLRCQTRAALPHVSHYSPHHHLALHSHLAEDSSLVCTTGIFRGQKLVPAIYQKPTASTSTTAVVPVEQWKALGWIALVFHRWRTNHSMKNTAAKLCLSSTSSFKAICMLLLLHSLSVVYDQAGPVKAGGSEPIHLFWDGPKQTPCSRQSWTAGFESRNHIFSGPIWNNQAQASSSSLEVPMTGFGLFQATCFHGEKNDEQGSEGGWMVSCFLLSNSWHSGNCTAPYGRNAGHLDHFPAELQSILHALELHSLSSRFLLNDSSIIMLLLKRTGSIYRCEMSLVV